MRLLRRWEQALESLVEGVFTGRGARIQPVEIGRKLARELLDNRRVSVSKTYVPNSYEVNLSSTDYDQVKSIQSSLISELTAYLSALANRENLSFVGELKIAFVEDRSMRPGHVQVSSQFIEDAGNRPAGEDSDTAEFQRIWEQHRDNPGEFRGALQCFAELTITEGPGAGSGFKITRLPVRIGRGYDNDLVISDPKASRNHAVIERAEDGFVLRDLGSLNGTTVNGKAVEKANLNDGDRIGIGTVSLEFRRVR